MLQSRSGCSRKRAWRFTLRTCVLFSIMLHLLLFYIPYQQRKVEAMSGCMSMSFVIGNGNPGQNTTASEAHEGPPKPKTVAEKQTTPTENQTVPVSKPEPVVQQQRKPGPVVSQKQLVPPKPKPVVRKQPVVKAKTPIPVVKKKAPPVKKVVVKKKQAKQVVKKPEHTHRKKTAKPVRKSVAAQKNKKSPDVPKKLASASAMKSSGESRTPQSNAGNEGQGKNTRKAQIKGGGGSKGPINAKFGSLYGPKITRWMRPKYPRKARDMGQTGLVLLRITIDANGRPVRVDVAKKAGSGFDEAAVAAARKSVFVPATHKGRPVACVALLPVRFNLKGQ